MADDIITNPVPAPDKVFKGDAGTAAKDITSEVAEKKNRSAIEEAMAAVTGTEDDVSGRTIPMGEPSENPLHQAVSRYFEVHERNFKDASHDIGFIIEYMKNEIGVTDVNDIDKIFTFLRTLEDNLSLNKDFDAKRYERVYNYLILRGKADAMNKALKALEK